MSCQRTAMQIASCEADGKVCYHPSNVNLNCSLAAKKEDMCSQCGKHKAETTIYGVVCCYDCAADVYAGHHRDSGAHI